jgi:hypothetical protein
MQGRAAQNIVSCCARMGSHGSLANATAAGLEGFRPVFRARYRSIFQGAATERAEPAVADVTMNVKPPLTDEGKV